MTRCAEGAHARGYKYFGIQFFGECHGSANGSLTFDKHWEAHQCIEGIKYPTLVGQCIRVRQLSIVQYFTVAILGFIYLQLFDQKRLSKLESKGTVELKQHK